MNPDTYYGCYTQSIQARRDIIEYDAPSFGKAFKLTDGKRLGDVEEAEEDQADEAVNPIRGAEEKGDPLAGYFVDDYELRVFAAGFAGDDGGGWDSEADGKGDPDKQADERGVGAGMASDGFGSPEQKRGDRAPCAGAGLAETGAEEGGEGPGPAGLLAGLDWSATGFRANCHRRCFWCGRHRTLPGLRGLRGRGWGS